MAGCPATLPAISLTAVQDKKGEGGGEDASRPKTRADSNTPTEHIVDMLLLCGTLSIIRYGLWA